MLYELYFYTVKTIFNNSLLATILWLLQPHETLELVHEPFQVKIERFSTVYGARIVEAQLANELPLDFPLVPYLLA